MNDDTFDDWPELTQLRELHQSDSMPADMRERVLRRAELARAPARSPLGLADASAALSPAALSPAAPWDEPARSPARKPRRGLTLGAGASLCAAAVLALWLTMPAEHVAVESEHPAPLELAPRSYTAAELSALGVQPGSSEVRVVGMLVSGSLTRLPPLPPHQPIRCGYHFHLRQAGAGSGDGIHVEYARCHAPDGLIDDGATCVQVTAVGLMRSDGHLDATRITPKSVLPCSLPH
jgi:hypothetical protein